MSWYDVAGGPVFWILVALGAASIILFVERMLGLRRVRVDYADFVKGVTNVLEKGNADEALAICDETPGPVATVVAAAIRHRRGSARALRDAVDMTGRAEVGRLERRLAALAIIAQAAPLLGLLGTILGMVRTVLALNGAPLVARADLMGGVVQALVVAAAGLIVAIPVQAMYAILSVRLERIVMDLEAAASEIVGFITAQAVRVDGAREREKER